MKRLRLFSVVFFLLFTVWFGRGASATTLVSLSLLQKFALADRVLEVKCLSTASAWSGAEKKEIRTIVVADLVEAFKGKIPDEKGGGKRILFSLPGGSVGDISQLVVGTPHIEVGDRFFIFLTLAAEPLGLGDGIYEVELIEGKESVRQKGKEFEGTEIAKEDWVEVERFRKVLRKMGR